nr:MAG TPA: hypothetical protein [Caudoviricetes sp.]
MVTLTLNDVYPEWITKGIFSYLNALEVPWKSDISGNQLDIIYHGSRSGHKIIGSLIENYLENNTVSDDNKITIAQAIFTIYIKNWNALYKTLSLEYNPIENYSMTETENVQDSHKGTTESDATDTDTNTETTIVNDTANNQLWGFNSTDSVNSDKQVGDTTRNVDGTRNTTHKNTDTETKDITSDRTLKRSGNIGVTTSQQMIESERQLWFWNFFENVFSDIDKILVLKIY